MTLPVSCLSLTCARALTTSSRRALFLHSLSLLLFPSPRLSQTPIHSVGWHSLTHSLTRTHTHMAAHMHAVNVNGRFVCVCRFLYIFAQHNAKFGLKYTIFGAFGCLQARTHKQTHFHSNTHANTIASFYFIAKFDYF